MRQTGRTPALVLYEVTAAYLEGECNELAAFGYHRDGQLGKQPIVIGLLTAHDGEPVSVQVFEGNTADLLKVNEVVLVGDRGMIKAKLSQAPFKYITALTDPQIRKLIKQAVIQPELFEEAVVEVEHGEKRLILRRDPATQRTEQHRRADKICRLTALRAKPEAGLKRLQAWARRHKISGFIELSLNGRVIELHLDEAKYVDAQLLDGGYCIETDVVAEGMDKQNVHDRYKNLQRVEQDFRRLKTAALEVRPIFVRTAQRTRGQVFIAMLALKVLRTMARGLQRAFGTTDTNDNAETVASALQALSRLCLPHYHISPQEIIARPRPDERQHQILTALEVKLPAP